MNGGKITTSQAKGKDNYKPKEQGLNDSLFLKKKSPLSLFFKTTKIGYMI